MKYQLVRTSPYLSGQVRWDLIVNPSREIGDVYIRPISDNIVYNGTGSALGSRHVDNVKQLYNTIEDVFFESVSKFNSIGALYNSGYELDPYDHTYEMGVRRISYSLYNKQFSFLCPIWISENIDYSKLSFRLSIQDANPSGRRNNIIVSIRLHDRVVKYISEYMSSGADDTPLSDDLIGFKFDPIDAHITGLQVDKGRLSTIDIHDVISNLISIERPMMEFDDMIAKQFRYNHIVAQQLLNLNLVFDIQDLVGDVADTLLGHDLNITCRVYYGDNVLELKDLYTNYTFIPSYEMETRSMTGPNVLEHLQDYKAKDLAHVNKVVQPIFHWALLENPDIIYNMYDGFGPCFTDIDGVHRIQGTYYNQSNLAIDNYDVMENSLGWCSHYDLHSSNTFTEVVTKTELTHINLDKDVIWVNYNKFDLTTVEQPRPYEMSIGTIKYVNENQVPSGSISVGDNLRIVIREINDEKRVWIMSKDNDNLTLRSIYNTLMNDTITTTIPGDLVGDFTNLKSIIKLLYEKWIPPHKIEIYNSIYPYCPVNIDTDNTVNTYCRDVVSYKKYSNYVYIYRYSGNIIPLFISTDDRRYNEVYKYKQWSKVEDIVPSEYSKLLNMKYLPEYPRFIEDPETNDNPRGLHIDDNSFYSLTSCRFNDKRDEWYNTFKGEYTWKNDSRIYILPEEVSFSLTSSTDIEQRAKQKLYEYIFNLMGISYDDWLANWLSSIYKINIDFDYVSDRSLDIIYHIKYRLI